MVGFTRLATTPGCGNRGSFYSVCLAIAAVSSLLGPGTSIMSIIVLTRIPDNPDTTMIRLNASSLIVPTYVMNLVLMVHQMACQFVYVHITSDGGLLK